MLWGLMIRRFAKKLSALLVRRSSTPGWGAGVEMLEDRRLLAGGFGQVITFGGEDQFDAGNAIAIDSAGNRVITGYFQGDMPLDNSGGVR